MPAEDVTPDDSSVPDTSIVYRRITPKWYAIDPSTGERRLTSAAFSDLGGAMSVALGVELEQSEHDPAEVIAAYPDYGLVGIPVGELRKLGLGVVRSPTDGELCHGDVHGNKTKATKNKLRLLAEQHWVVKPPEAPAEDQPEDSEATPE